MEKAGITSADIPAGQKPAEFFDLTTVLARQANGPSTQTWAEPVNNKVPQCGIEPEIMIQAGPYNLYIGSGVTETTLTTVLRVIGHA